MTVTVGTKQFRRAGIRARDLSTALHAASRCGITPSAIDALPGGLFRLHFGPVAANDRSMVSDDLDIQDEIARWKNGQR